MGYIDEDKIVAKFGLETYQKLCEAMYFYERLRASEAKTKPAVDFMETVQQAEEITPSMRAMLIDWLVEVARDYRLLPKTLYLTINYIDRFLSGNPIDCQRFQLLGVACMVIASKYEERRGHGAPQLVIAEGCDYYSKDEVLQMESSVLNFFKFDMTAPTVVCFLWLIYGSALAVPAAQRDDNMACDSRQLEFYLASYICDLSLLDYDMLCYAPSLIAASAIFLARYVLLNNDSSQKPWCSYLTHFTCYQPSDLQECVNEGHTHVFVSPNYELTAIRQKYSRPKYKRVAEITCPASIPLENFDNN